MSCAEDKRSVRESQALILKTCLIVDLQDFDNRYGSGWQCVVGSNFGCFFTHSKGSFIYFKLETLNFLIFKGVTSSAP